MAKLSEAQALFPGSEVVRVAELPEECALVSDQMSEKAFEEKAQKLGGVISRIRLV
mgnify:FL=1